jgi:hypothetical protein
MVKLFDPSVVEVAASVVSKKPRVLKKKSAKGVKRSSSALKNWGTNTIRNKSAIGILREAVRSIEKKRAGDIKRGTIERRKRKTAANKSKSIKKKHYRH